MRTGMAAFARRASQIAAAYTTPTNIQVGLNTAADHSEDADGQQRNGEAAPERNGTESHAHRSAARRDREAEERAAHDARPQRAAVVCRAPARPPPAAAPRPRPASPRR